MKIYGSFTEQVTLVFRDAGTGFQVTLQPNASASYSADRVVSLPQENAASVLVSKTSTDTLLNKTLTSPTINGGTHTAITGFGIRDTSAAFDVTVAAVSSTALTAGRTLTLDMINSARTIKLGGDLTLAANFITSGANSLTLTTTGSTNVTLPTTGTLATLAGSEALTSKTIGNTNTVTLKDTLFTLQDDGDTSKQVQFQLSGISTATTRTFTFPDASGTFATSAAATPTVAGIVTTFVPTIASAVKSVSSANYIILDTDGYDTVLVSTAASQRTITLPAVANATGRKITIKKTDSGAGTVLISVNGGNIDGASSNVLNAQYSFVTIVSDGSNWFVEAVWDTITSGTVTGVTLTSNSQTNIASVSVTPGQWLSAGYGGAGSSNTLTMDFVCVSVGSASGTQGTNAMLLAQAAGTVILDGGRSTAQLVPPQISINLTTATTYYLVGRAIIVASSGTLSWTGLLTFNRVR